MREKFWNDQKWKEKPHKTQTHKKPIYQKIKLVFSNERE